MGNGVEKNNIWMDNKLAIAILILLLTTMAATIPRAAVFETKIDSIESSVQRNVDALERNSERITANEKMAISAAVSAADTARRLKRIEDKLDVLLETRNGPK